MIDSFLRERIGLDVESFGRGKFDADVARRMEACGLKDAAHYEALLRSSQEEFDSLVKLLTVSETWFFRAYDSFIFLEEHLRAEWSPAVLSKAPRKLRMLSIPCSSGEEPYSIAMTCLRCGLTPDMFSIDAYDINHANIERARKGVYTKYSFRSELQWFKPLHFTEHGGHFHLESRVKDCVRFEKGNLLEFRPPSSKADLYDIVFCRNLLIYFDNPSRRKALDILNGLLIEGGLFFLGHAESTSLLFGSSFSPVPAKGSFAFRKLKQKEAQPSSWSPMDTHKLLKVFSSPGDFTRRSSVPAADADAAQKAAPPPPPSPVLPAPPRPLPSDGKLLAEARSLADKGLLNEALELCRQHVANCKLDAEGYFLQGVIFLSMKHESEAENCLNKAIFLNPSHFEALLSLAALREGRGDAKGASLYRRRAGREAQAK